MQPITLVACLGEFLPLLSPSAGEIHVQSDLNLESDFGNVRLSISFYKCLDWTGRVLMQYEALPNESGGILLNIGRQDGFVPFQIHSATVIIH